MQFFTYADVPDKHVTKTFKDAAWRSLLWVTVIMAVITGYTAIPKGEATNPVLIAVPFFATMFFGLLGLWRLQQCRNPRNWLVKATGDGLYLNLQPNITAPLATDAPSVFYVPNEAIRTVTRVQESRTLPERNGQYKNHFTYFDLEVSETIPETLLVALAQIRRNPRLRGGIGIRRDLHGAVRVQGPFTLRLVWDWMTPRELAAEAWFGTRYTLEPLKKIKTPGWDKMTPEEQETYIDTLWEWGHVQDAVHLSSLTRTTSARAAANYLSDRLG